MSSILSRYESLRSFSNDEAWLLYRLAAFSEALGWSLLIAGLLVKRYIFNGNNDAVLVGGQIHGILFLSYFAAVITLYPSLSWRRREAIIALVLGVPPYGSLIFEKWMAYKRRQAQQADLIYSLILRTIGLQKEK